MSIEVSNPDKTLFHEPDITKEEFVDYYRLVADVMIPHVRDRPLMLRRFPNGIDTKGFYQKQTPDYYPSFIERAAVEHSDGQKKYALANNADALAYLANQGAIEIHAWTSRHPRIAFPDQLSFDLDPGKSTFDDVQWAAGVLRRLLERLGAQPYVKTSGSKGLHVMVALRAQEDFDAVRAFAKTVARTIEKQFPKRITTDPRKDARGDRLLIDYWRNAFSQTQVAPYSVRALPNAPVSAPLHWDEALRQGFDPQEITIRDMGSRLALHGDRWHDFGRRPVSIKEMRMSIER